MKERPIIFSGPMVRAILDGRKTVTRRVVKRCKDMGFGCQLAANELAGEINTRDYTNSKYGQPGDRLWVRENFQPLYADGVSRRCDTNYETGKGYKISYPATDGVIEFYNEENDDSFCNRVTPSIFMPRWASRITLEIVAVRVERLQDIDTNDCYEEGIERPNNPALGSAVCERDNAQNAYRKLWDGINAKRAPWASNPYVWALTFKRLANG